MLYHITPGSLLSSPPDLGPPLLRRAPPPVTVSETMIHERPQNDKILEIFLDEDYSDQEYINNGTYQQHVPTTEGNVPQSLAINHPIVAPHQPLVSAAPVRTLQDHKKG